MVSFTLIQLILLKPYLSRDTAYWMPLWLVGVGVMNVWIGIGLRATQINLWVIPIMAGMISLNFGYALLNYLSANYHPSVIGIRAGISVFLVGLVWLYG